MLSHDEILSLRAAVVSARLAGSRIPLLAGIDPTFVASLPVANAPVEQIACDLDALNGTGLLLDGSLPLRTWLKNAAAFTEARREGSVFREALAMVERFATRTGADKTLVSG